MDESDKLSSNQNTITSSILQEVTASALVYHMPDDQRHVAVIYKRLEEMERELHDLKVKKILEETQLPPELLEQNNLIPQISPRLRRGLGFRPVLRSEVEEAKKHSIFGTQQARYLKISLTTYKKYARLYGLWEPCPHGPGIKRPHDPNIGKYSLNKILAGELYGNPFITDWMVRKKLFRAKTFPECCDQCGYNKRRITDQHVSLLIDHKDGDRKNFKLENLRFLCWNCTVECGRGYLRRKIHLFDRDIKLNEGTQ
jgi:hypothetical protein